MAGTIQYSAVDAGVLVQIADAANGNLAQTPFLPVGWDLFTTITTPGLGSPQAILAGGMLPSTGAAVAVLAFGAPASAFLPYYTPAMHTLAPPLNTTLLPPPPPPPPVLPPPAIDNGFQALYLRLQSLIGTALTNFATSYSYCVTTFCRLDVAAFAPQQGHRGRVFASAVIKRARIVAIEFGKWRSGRKGGSSGSITVG